MTPQKQVTGGVEAVVSATSLEDGIAKLVINDEGEHYIAAWNGHEFEVILVQVNLNTRSGIAYTSPARDKDNTRRASEESIMEVYFPVDPRMTPIDVRGATVAYFNDDRDGWLFAHCDADWHLDHEARLQGAVSAAFESEIERANKVFRDAVYDCFLVNDRGNQAAVSAWNRMVHNLNEFRDDVKEAVVVEAQTRHLGYFHQNPHEAHIHAPIEHAIRAAIPKWQARTNRLLEWNPIETYVNAVLTEVATKHVYETRWAKEARLKAEAEAAANDADNDGDTQ